MSYGTIINQGSFISTGLTANIAIRSDVDWMQVINYTQAGAGNINTGVKYFWQRGMAANDGFVEFHAAATQVLSLSTSAALAVGGFTLLDTYNVTPSAPIAEAAISNVVAPVVTAATAGLAIGSVIRFSNDAGAHNLMGIDFQVGAITPGVNFTLAYNLANAPGAAGTGGFYSIISASPVLAPWYPARRTVCNVTQAQYAVVTTTVYHNLTVGQAVRFSVPAAMGMIQLNGLTGNVVAVSNTFDSFTVDIDTSAFNPFVWPLNAAVPFTPAQVIPFGEDSQIAPNDLSDGTINQSYIGMSLAGGAESPAGAAQDVIYWIAGKSENV